MTHLFRLTLCSVICVASFSCGLASAEEGLELRVVPKLDGSAEELRGHWAYLVSGRESLGRARISGEEAILEIPDGVSEMELRVFVIPTHTTRPGWIGSAPVSDANLLKGEVELELNKTINRNVQLFVGGIDNPNDFILLRMFGDASGGDITSRVTSQSVDGGVAFSFVGFDGLEYLPCVVWKNPYAVTRGSKIAVRPNVKSDMKWNPVRPPVVLLRLKCLEGVVPQSVVLEDESGLPITRLERIEEDLAGGEFVWAYSGEGVTKGEARFSISLAGIGKVDYMLNIPIVRQGETHEELVVLSPPRECIFSIGVDHPNDMLTIFDSDWNIRYRGGRTGGADFHAQLFDGRYTAFWASPSHQLIEYEFVVSGMDIQEDIDVSSIAEGLSLAEGPFSSPSASLTFFCQVQGRYERVLGPFPPKIEGDVVSFPDLSPKRNSVLAFRNGRQWGVFVPGSVPDFIGMEFREVELRVPNFRDLLPEAVLKERLGEGVAFPPKVNVLYANIYDKDFPSIQLGRVDISGGSASVELLAGEYLAIVNLADGRVLRSPFAVVDSATDVRLNLAPIDGGL